MDQEHEKTVTITLYPPNGKPMKFVAVDGYFDWGINSTERTLHFRTVSDPKTRYETNLPFLVIR